MKVVIQRVSEASVTINKNVVASIQTGLLILVGIENADTQSDIDWLCSKISGLRIFPDKDGVMNTSIQDIDGEVIIVSQFTLHASTKKGKRPSYLKASKPDVAIPLYENFKNTLQDHIKQPIQSGEFGADMKVNLVNDGPVTIIIDTKNKV